MNTTTTVISVKVDKNLKKAAQEVADSAGFSLSTLLNAYMRQLVATRRVDFQAPEQMTPRMEKIIAQADKDIKNGDTIGPFASVDDFLKALRADDED